MSAKSRESTSAPEPAPPPKRTRTVLMSNDFGVEIGGSPSFVIVRIEDAAGPAKGTAPATVPLTSRTAPADSERTPGGRYEHIDKDS